MIPVREFAEIIEVADTAYKCGDYQTIARINKRLATVNINLFWGEDGEPYTVILNRPDIIKPEDDTP